ncbi:MAG: PH domain-containing protein [Saprospiraceae bacterium]|nr:PH domain-containing protein [Saprospiraceae bacterium]|tara:strand:- start:11004 stop:12503 length:1500 start_codon:yes stop_codon:yes gene_type:complete
MKKNEAIDFSIPQRQSILAIIFIVLKFLRAFVGQAWILIIPIVMGRGSSTGGWETWELAAAGMGVFSTIWSVIAYFRYYYSLTDTELVIKKGILKKSDINVPYERIQSVNFKQNFLHQMLNVAEVAIDTAGSGEKEIQIDALSLENAKKLRSEILKRKKKEVSDTVLDGDENLEEVENILTLSTSDLFKIGLTQNHFKPVGLIIGLIFSSFAYSWQLDLDPQDIFKNIYTFLEDRSFLQSIIIAFLLIVFSVLYSIVTTFLNHANLTFFRNEDKFQLNQGLLTRKEVAAVDKKIQYISWGQNILQRLLGFHKLSFQQAGANAVKQKVKNNFKIPGCTEDKIDFVKKEWLGKLNYAQSFESVSIHYFYYSFRWIIGLFSIAIAVNLYFYRIKTAIVLTAIMIYATYITWLSYKKKKYSINSDQLQISGGGLGFSHLLMPTFKIQNVAMTQSPYQWRRKLASLRIYTAAGSLEIPFISEQRAAALMDKLLYEVERSKKAWM